MPSTRSSAATKCISDVPGLVKQVSTPHASSVRMRLSAPFTKAWPRRPSVDRGAGVAHDLAPFFVLGVHESRELLRAERARLDACAAEALLQLLVLQRLRRFGVEALDDVLRRAGGRGEIQPERSV